MRKKISVLMLLIATLVFTSACGGGNKEEVKADADTQQVAGETRDNVIIHVENPWDTMDPHQTGAYVDRFVIEQIYEPLVYVSDEGEIEPGLAEKWEISEDGLVYTFDLREGVKFHNGEPLKASDVVFSVNRSAEHASMMDYVAYIDKTEAISDNQVQITLKNSFAPFLSNITRVIVLNEKFVTENNDNISQIACGTGGYKLEEIEMNTKANLVANEEYWRGVPSIKNIEFKIIIDATASVMAFQSGEIDFMVPSASSYLEMKESGEYNTQEYAALHTAVININNTAAPFDNKLVRQALNYATDRDTMIEIAFEGLAEPALLLANESSFGVDYAAAKKYPYDLEKAKELLTEAGYPDGLDLGTLNTIAGGYHEKIATILQSSLAEIGVTMDIMPMESGALIDAMTKGDYTFGNMGLSFTSDFSYDGRYYRTENIGANNNDQYSNAEVDKYFDLGDKENDPELRKEYYAKAIEIITEEAPNIPVFHKQTLFIWNKDLNAVPHIDGSRQYFVHEWSWN